jgi:hypothetical protein
VRLEPLACTGGGPWCGAHSRTGDGCARTHLDE